MKTIASRDNARFRELLELAESARERRQRGRVLLDGAHLVEAALDAGIDADWLLLAEPVVDGEEALVLRARVPAERQLCLAEPLLRRLSPVKTPTGVMAVIPRPLIAGAADFAIFVEDVQDPGNLGAILRTAAAAGVDAAYLSPGCADPWSPKTLRGGMGAHFRLAIHDHADLLSALNAFPGLTLAASLDAETSLFDLDLRGPLGLLVGNEGAGLSAPLLAAAGQRVRLPMAAGMESLNAAAAAAICLYERVRQRGGCFSKAGVPA